MVPRCSVENRRGPAFVACPRCGDDRRLHVSAVVEGKVLDAVVFADERFHVSPGV